MITKKKHCKICNKQISYYGKNTLCDPCFRDERRKQYISKWLQNGLITKGKPSKWIRNYILSEQGNKCILCGVGVDWNDKPLVFILDHIDGHSTNNRRENLRMVCPNCDSQLPTYKVKNRGNGLKYYRDAGNLRYKRKVERCLSLA